MTDTIIHNTKMQAETQKRPMKAKTASLLPWWKGAVIYQIYPRSYADSNGDGVGDLNGIIEKLSHISTLGVDAVWLSPFFTSPMVDFGYDVSDFCGVDPIFGTLNDFDRLLARAKDLGLKVIIDQVYSHTSDQHDWFVESKHSRENDKSDYYVWVDPQADGTPPNNWQSVFGGGAWEWSNRRGQYYLHNFLKEQPDLNLHNRRVQKEILAVAKFWLDRGVDGFRLDALNFGMHDLQLRNNPAQTKFKRPPTRPHDFQSHIYSMSQPELLPFVEELAQLINNYPDRFTVAEVGGPFPLDEMKAFTHGDQRLNSAYNFDFLYADTLCANTIRNTVNNWPGEPNEGWPSWAFSNHDAPRAVSRWRGNCDPDQYSKLIAMVLLSLRGNAFIYQGEELALPQSNIAFEDLQDPEAIANWPETLGRDGARTPMPWSKGNDYAGFGTTKPWLPVDPAHARRAVELQEGQPGTPLEFYKTLIKLRQKSPSLRVGDMDVLHEDQDVLVLRRKAGTETTTAVFNLTDKPLPVPAELSFSSILLSIGNPLRSSGYIAAYSGFISE